MSIEGPIILLQLSRSFAGEFFALFWIDWVRTQLRSGSRRQIKGRRVQDRTEQRLVFSYAQHVNDNLSENTSPSATCSAGLATIDPRWTPPMNARLQTRRCKPARRIRTSACRQSRHRTRAMQLAHLLLLHLCFSASSNARTTLLGPHPPKEQEGRLHHAQTFLCGRTTLNR